MGISTSHNLLTSIIATKDALNVKFFGDGPSFLNDDDHILMFGDENMHVK